MVYWKKLMVYNGILMETIGISVMVSIGLLLFFFLAGMGIRLCQSSFMFLIHAKEPAHKSHLFWESGYTNRAECFWYNKNNWLTRVKFWESGYASHNVLCMWLA